MNSRVQLGLGWFGHGCHFVGGVAVSHIGCKFSGGLRRDKGDAWGWAFVRLMPFCKVLMFRPWLKALAGLVVLL